MDYMHGEHGEETQYSFVMFYHNAVTDKPHVKITFPADDKTVFDQPVEVKHKLQYSREWEAFSKGLEQWAGQTRIEDVAWVDEGTSMQLKTIGVHTVEQLLAVQDNVFANLNIGGGESLRIRAESFLKDKFLLSEAKKSDDEKAVMQNQIDELKAQMAALARGSSDVLKPESVDEQTPKPARRTRKSDKLEEALAA